MTKRIPAVCVQPIDKDGVKDWICAKAAEFSFSDCGFLSVHYPLFVKQTKALKAWLDQGLNGTLDFMHENHDKRTNPALLVDGAKTIITVRMDYLHDLPKPRSVMDNTRPNHAIIARYARGRDYHKTVRQQLKKLAKAIENELPQWQHLSIGADKLSCFARSVIQRPSLSALLPMQQDWDGRASTLY